MAIDPTGSFLYETALEIPQIGGGPIPGGVNAYVINRSDGSLTKVSGSPYLTNLSLYSDVVDQQGKFLYVQGASGIHVFSIQPGTGSLTEVAGSPFWGPGRAVPPTIVFGEPGSRMALDQTNHYLYVSTSAGVFGFSTDSSTGQLTALPGSPFSVGATNSFSIVIAPSNKFLYETRTKGISFSNDGNLYGYSINQSTGALIPLSGSPFSLGICSATSIPNNMTIARPSKFLYLANCGTYSIDPQTGAVAQVSNFVPGDWPVIDPTGKFLWAITAAPNCPQNCPVGVTTYQVDPNTGVLTVVPNSTLYISGGAFGSVLSLAITQ